MKTWSAFSLIVYLCLLTKLFVTNAEYAYADPNEESDSSSAEVNKNKFQEKLNIEIGGAIEEALAVEKARDDLNSLKDSRQKIVASVEEVQKQIEQMEADQFKRDEAQSELDKLVDDLAQLDEELEAANGQLETSKSSLDKAIKEISDSLSSEDSVVNAEDYKVEDSPHQKIIKELIEGKKFGDLEPLTLINTLQSRSQEIGELKRKVNALNDSIVKLYADTNSNWENCDLEKEKGYRYIEYLSHQVRSFSYEDRWIQNKNIESMLDNTIKIVNDFATKLENTKCTKGDVKIFTDNTTLYLERLSSSHRYNIGLGFGLGFMPTLNIKGDISGDISTLDSEFSGTISGVTYSEKIATGSHFSPLLTASTPYFYIDLMIPNSSSSSNADIPVRLIETDDGDAFYIKYGAKDTVNIDFDVHVKITTFNMFNIFRYYGRRKSQFDGGIGLGFTGLNWEQERVYEARKRTDPNSSFSDLPEGTKRSDKYDAFVLAPYVSLVSQFSIADQLEAGLDVKYYVDTTRELKDSEIGISGGAATLSFKYYFF